MTTLSAQVQFNQNQKGNAVSHNIAKFFADNADRFESGQTVAVDTARIMKMSKSGITEADAQELAFLLWRARMVQRYVNAVAGRPVTQWGEAVWHAWQRSETFHAANAARKERIAQAEARRERLDALVQTGVEQSTHDSKAAKAELVKQAKAAKK